MSTMKNLNHNDFNKICRICLSACVNKFLRENVISDMYYMIMGIHFATNDKLPKQICHECYEKINVLNAFVSQCKESHDSLMKCLEQHEIVKDEEENVTDGDELEITSENSVETSEIPNNQLTKHERKHSGKRRFACNICNYTCNYANILKHHKRTNHLENSDNTEIEIPSTLTRKINNKNVKFNLNEREHSSGRPFKCEFCRKAYNHKSNLTRHKHVHSGERPFKCAICRKTFIYLHNLKSHKRIHQGERPFKCEICIKTFSRLHHLNTHVKRKHNSKSSDDSTN